MTPLIPALAGALLVTGLLGVFAGARPRPDHGAAPTRHGRPPWMARTRLTTVQGRLSRITPRMRVAAVAGVLVGAGVAVVTGWVVALAVVPAAVLGLPVLLSPPPSAARIGRLEALEEWARSLAGVLTVGVGLEQAMVATLRSTPDPIRPEVTVLTARLRARWTTEDALRAFADDLDDSTGDLVAAYLILGARRRGSGLASVLESLAESVASDVRSRRQVEADRAKPRSTARTVTLITVAVLLVLALTGDYVQPYGTPLGQLLLTTLLALYVLTLVWMRRMTAGPPLPRFIGARTGRAVPAAQFAGVAGVAANAGADKAGRP